MSSTVEDIVATKLRLVARETEAELIRRQGEIFKRITPLPSCANVLEVTDQICETCIKSIQSRANTAIEWITRVLTNANQSMSDSLKERLAALCDELLPEGLYVEQMDKIPGVFMRGNASPNKFDERVFEIRRTACHACLMNLVRRERQRVQLEIDLLGLRFRALARDVVADDSPSSRASATASRSTIAGDTPTVRYRFVLMGDHWSVTLLGKHGRLRTRLACVTLRT